MKAAGVVLATALALALQTTLARFVIRGTVAVDLVLVVVVYTALVSGPVTGLLAGTFAGLVQDALSTGVMLYIIGRSLAGRMVGFFSALFFLGHHGVRIYSRLIMSEVPTAFLYTAILGALLVLAFSNRLRKPL